MSPENHGKSPGRTPKAAAPAGAELSRNSIVPGREDPYWEERFQVLKDQARATGRFTGQTDLSHAVAEHGPPKTGYYGLPAIKPPVWTWEIPLYFFAGGISGMSGVLAFAGWLAGGNLDLARAALWIAFAGSVISTALLVKDLGRPSRFYNMLRVFKWRSAMSVGSWILAFFGGAATIGAILTEWHYRTWAAGNSPDALLLMAGLFAAATGLSGAILATYTGVLISATAVPAWSSHHKTIPLHFGVTGLGSAAALLELLGFTILPLHVIGFVAAGAETLLAAWIEFRGKGALDRPLREGRSGWMIRASGLLAGPSALLLRAFGMVPLAAAAFLAGALINRYGWLQAGRVSARDPEAVLLGQRQNIPGVARARG
jgi:hypothetical protein